MKDYAQYMGCKLTHFAVSSECYENKQFVTLKRKEKELVEFLALNITPDCIEMYAVPKAYNCIGFDYILQYVITNKYILIVVDESLSEKFNVNYIISVFNKYIEIDQVELCTMGKNEPPYLYAEIANSIESFKTLEIISQF